MKKNLILSHVAIMMATMPGARRPQLCLNYDIVESAGACDVNIGGLKSTALFNSRKNITAYPTPKTAVSSKDLGILEGAYTCVSTPLEFQSLSLDHELSDIKYVGAAPGIGPFKATCKLFVRGDKDEVEGFAAQAQYDEMVFIITQSDGKRKPVGNADYPARVKAMFDSKTVEATDPRGWEFEITSYCIHPERLDSTVVVPII